ncbi:MAG: hypothetical protein OXB88_05370, partial [Bacteriovoracales bacterium]|nr:hypothetical protein [Bacteriovoracales bacterium]
METMSIFNETKELVEKERGYTVKILKNLMSIERNKLYSDLKYPSLHKYLVRELGYSDAEAVIRANAVRLMLKSKKAESKIERGELSLSNAATVNKVLQSQRSSQKPSPSLVDKMVEEASTCSARKFQNFVWKEFKKERRETVVLGEHVLVQFDRLRKEYGDLSTLELIQVMLERELKTPKTPQRKRDTQKNNASRRGQIVAGPKGRSISAAVKREVYDGKCNNCGVRYGLEYD